MNASTDHTEKQVFDYKSYLSKGQFSVIYNAEDPSSGSVNFNNKNFEFAISAGTKNGEKKYQPSKTYIEWSQNGQILATFSVKRLNLEGYPKLIQYSIIALDFMKNNHDPNIIYDAVMLRSFYEIISSLKRIQNRAIEPSFRLKSTWRSLSINYLEKVFDTYWFTEKTLEEEYDFQRTFNINESQCDFLAILNILLLKQDFSGTIQNQKNNIDYALAFSKEANEYISKNHKEFYKKVLDEIYSSADRRKVSRIPLTNLLAIEDIQLSNGWLDFPEYELNEIFEFHQKTKSKFSNEKYLDLIINLPREKMYSSDYRLYRTGESLITYALNSYLNEELPYPLFSVKNFDPKGRSLDSTIDNYRSLNYSRKTKLSPTLEVILVRMLFFKTNKDIKQTVDTYNQFIANNDISLLMFSSYVINYEKYKDLPVSWALVLDQEDK